MCWATRRLRFRYAVKLRFLAGLASQLAEWSGQSADRNFQLGLARVAAQASVPYGLVLAGEYNAQIDGNGVARPDPEMLYSAMTLQPALYRDISFALRELTGGNHHPGAVVDQRLGRPRHSGRTSSGSCAGPTWTPSIGWGS